MGNSFNKNKTGAMLRQSQARINIHRSKKLSGIAKKKDDICKHLEAGNEMNAKIWCETLINEEGIIPCYDVVSTMCDQVNGRLTQIEKFGAPKDMNTTFATIIHAAPKLDVDELIKVRKDLASILPKDFVKECDTNYDLINPVVADNIDFKKPEDGAIVLRMVNLAKERNISYTPTHESCTALFDYCQRKGIPVPEGVGGVDGPVPQYVPQPIDFNNLDQAPAEGQMAPQMQPPVMPVPGAPMGQVPMAPPAMNGMPAYNPQQQMMPPQQPMYQPQTQQPDPGFMPNPPMNPPMMPQDPQTMAPQAQMPDANAGGDSEADLEARLRQLRGED